MILYQWGIHILLTIPCFHYSSRSFPAKETFILTERRIGKQLSTMENTLSDKAIIYKLPVDKAYEALETTSQGLTQAQAQERQKEQGKNLISSKKKKSAVLTFLGNFTHLMAILLWVAGAVAFFAGMPQLGVAVWLVNVINGVFSFWQESRADKATDCLLYTSPSPRDMRRSRMPSSA